MTGLPRAHGSPSRDRAKQLFVAHDIARQESKTFGAVRRFVSVAKLMGVERDAPCVAPCGGRGPRRGEAPQRLRRPYDPTPAKRRARERASAAIESENEALGARLRVRLRTVRPRVCARVHERALARAHAGTEGRGANSGGAREGVRYVAILRSALGAVAAASDAATAAWGIQSERITRASHAAGRRLGARSRFDGGRSL